MHVFNSFSDSVRGIVLAIIAIFLISIQDILVKLLSGTDVPLHQLLVIRYVLALIMFGWLVVFISSYDGLKTKHLGKHMMRGVLAFLSGVCYYLALSVLPVAETVAIFFSAPLFVTVLSVVLLGDHVGINRWAATIVGFIGVLIMVRPGGDVFNPMAFLVIIAALCYALSMLLARKMGHTESAVNLSFYSMVVNLLGAGTVALMVHLGLFEPLRGVGDVSFITNPWVMPDTTTIIIIAAVSLITVVTFHMITQAYRIAPPSLLALFEYTTMFWAVLWGVTFFDQYPDQATIVGMLLVITAGLYTIGRESWIGAGHRKWFTGRALSRHR